MEALVEVFLVKMFSAEISTLPVASKGVNRSSGEDCYVAYFAS